MYCLDLAVLLHRALEGRVENLMNNFSIPGWQQDPEGLHEVRVASRRVRAVLDLVEPGIYPGFKRQRRKVRRLTHSLGRTREMDVHIAILEEMGVRALAPAQGPGMEHALEVIEARRDKARMAMARGLSRLSLKNLPRLLQVPSLPDPFRAGELAGAVWNILEPWLEGAFAAEALLDAEDVQALHALRIRIKRLRYALEVLGPGFPVAPEAQLKHLRALQTALGDHHDRATLEALLAGLHQGLVARDRPLLAAGVLGLLGMVGEERLIAFEHFRALAVGTPKAAFMDGLRRDLGLEPGGIDAP